MTEAKAKQIVVRFDRESYGKISVQAKAEHRGLGEFVRHATLDYIERRFEECKRTAKQDA